MTGTDLYIVRHGQTVFNAPGSKTFSGWLDVPLSPTGEGQMRALAQRLNDVPFDRAFTSRLRRCTRSLEILLEPHGPVQRIIDDRIIERNYGDLNGRTHADVTAEFPGLIDAWHRSYDVPPPGGESLKMVEKRVYPFLADLLRAAGTHESILVCAHGNSIRAMRAFLEDLDVQAEMAFEVTQEDYYQYRLVANQENLLGADVHIVHLPGRAG